MTVSAAELLGWYDVARRDLPWREPGVTAWQILVSEFMLQQTPVSRVQPIWLDPCHAGLRRRPLTPIGLVRSQLSSSRCTSAAGVRFGDAGVVPARDRWHQRDQRLRRQTGHIQKHQQRLQLGHPAVGRTDAERTALRRQERDNVGRGEVLDPAVLGHTLPQDRAGQLQVTHDRGVGQTSISNKPPTVTLLPAPRPATAVRVTRQAPLRISDSPAADPNLARPARIAFR
jgi:hypothetical protein